MQRITAPDGAGIVLHSRGSGPDLVVVHGGGVTAHEYRRLAARLADRFTVHLYNRRGRADAAPRREPYTVEQEIDDLGAVLAHTGARRAIGHSYGAFVVLRAALRLPLDRIALYDTPLRLAGHGLPTAFLGPAEEAVRAGNTARALAIVGAAVNPQSPASKLPLGVRTAICRAFLRTEVGRTMGGLVGMTLVESRQVQAHEGPADEYAAITAETLLISGARAAPYFTEINDRLAAVIPRARTLRVPGSPHNGIAVAPPALINPLASFFTAPTTRQAS
ncbi:alpha/beta fold hydrolase [Micromonospora chaiyaphumensis]|uniref:Pimeloyl-ACP methyl ester carboxylesterase n=1 Tax=Micromonospora chaiyaphumensis TaxID=307119 RepID=A0A1C4UFY1_9ACTN|nr:alpha/beta fold hydrolase [Micromonospora chaiyaphumensis]SCE70588.1 Pimeloyl-ACP methyl ester carboxylesterase [Micromonospora chaiyaphumensis]